MLMLMLCVQGRLPIRVTLKGLSQDDLYRILTEPVTNLIRQQIEMLKSEMVTLSFTDDAIKEIARVAFEVRNCFFASFMTRLLDCYLTATATAVATAVAPLLYHWIHSITSHHII
jgi:ATP-dependent protease HslVU (ClpYQ) ATPase subunit